VRDVLARNDAEALRYFFLGAHYRVPVSFDVEKLGEGRVVFPSLDEAERRVDYLYTTRETLLRTASGASAEWTGAPDIVREAIGRVLEALDKDLNTPVALSILGELAKAANELGLSIPRLKKDAAAQARARGHAAAAIIALDTCCKPLGLMLAPPEEFAARTRARRLQIRGLEAATVDAKVAERTAARGAKEFARADAVRAELEAMGVEILDAAGDTSWRMKV